MFYGRRITEKQKHISVCKSARLHLVQEQVTIIAVLKAMNAVELKMFTHKRKLTYRQQECNVF